MIACKYQEETFHFCFEERINFINFYDSTYSDCTELRRNPDGNDSEEK